VEIQDKEQAKHYREVLKEFFHRLGLVIQTHQDFLTGVKSIWTCSKSSCYYQDIKMTWKLDGGKFFIEFALSNNYIFHLVAFSKDRYFNRMKIFVQNEKDLGIKRNPLELKLFLNACYQKEVSK